MEKSETKNEVYYDGNCPMCRVFIKKANELDQSSFEMRDIHDGHSLENTTFESLNQEIHLKTKDGVVYKNADAILKIVSISKKWPWVEKIGELPIIKQLLRTIYDLIARNRFFIFGTKSRIFYSKAIIVAGFISGLLLSIPLWMTERLYPHVPVVTFLPQLTHRIDLILFIGLLLLLLWSIFTKRVRVVLSAVIVVIGIFVLLDQSRLQPWVYQYTFMLLALALFSWKRDDDLGYNFSLNICRFIVASIYFYSGLQKLNIEFIYSVFPWMITPISNHFPPSLSPSFFAFVILVPIIEMAIGLFLLSKKMRTVGIVFATAMCVFVLFALGPLGHNWNSVVWPWNIALIFLAYVLFYRENSFGYKEVFVALKKKQGLIFLILFGILPATYFLNMWDSYPSWSLYSGTTNQAKIRVRNEVFRQFPESLKKFVEQDENGNVFFLNTWSFVEMNVPAYPERRVFKSIAHQLCEKYAKSNDDIILEMSGRLTWYNNSGKQVLKCSDL